MDDFRDLKKGLTQKQCIQSVRKTLGDEATSEKTVYDWFTELRRSRVQVSDVCHEDRFK